MTIANESTMRRIAIVLASLPEPVAQRLLGSLHSDSQRSIRAALGSLSDVDPLERRRALDGFANSLRKDKLHGSKHSDAAEIVFSRAAIRNLKDPSRDVSLNVKEHGADSDATTATSSGKPPAPLAFLRDVDDETMVEHLSGEMPQTLAIILASISPAQAARVLPRLDIAVRTEAMRRMASLKELPSELIDDIGNQLRRRLVPAHGTGGAGRVALDAILAEMPNENVQRPVRSESSNDSMGVKSSSIIAEELEAPTRTVVKLAEGTWPESEKVDSRRVLQMNNEPSEKQRDTSPLASTDSIHSYLMALPTDRLRDALASVAIRTALLTLCGLPRSKAEAILASLPRRQAKQVREQLSQLGTLDLREIDEAKEKVATLVSGGQVENSKPRMTAAA